MGTEWVSALTDTWSSHMLRSPNLGESDCYTFVADYCRARGLVIDVPTYHTEQEATDVLALHGTAENLLNHYLGVANEQLQAGDVVLCRLGDVAVPGVYNGLYVLCAVHGRGLLRLPKQTVVKSWSA